MSDDDTTTPPPEAIAAKPGRHVLTLEDRRRGGRIGGKVRSPARRAAVRVNGYKNGRHAKSVTHEEVVEARLRRIDPDLPELIAAVIDDLANGRVDAPTRVLVRSMLEHEVLRQKMVTEVSNQLTVKDVLLGKDGVPYGERLKAHPLLEFVQKLQRSILDSAEAIQATPKSSGQGAKDAAMTAVLERAAMLRGADKSRMLSPSPALIDVTPEE